MFKQRCFVPLVLFLSGMARGDQPVHCLRGQEYGEWKFHVSSEAKHVNLFNTSEVCTHMLPNKVQLISKDHSFKFKDEDVWKVKVMDKY